MKVKSEVAQSCPTPSDPMDCSLPGSSVHGIFQARVLGCHCLLRNNTLEGLNIKITEAEEQISDLEDRMVEISAAEENIEKRMIKMKIT